MKTLDLDANAILTAVAACGSSFRTKDVSEQPVTLAAHPERDAYYHQAVGRYLSEHRVELGIRLESKGSPPRGARWSRSGAVATASSSLGCMPGGATPRASLSVDAHGELGPQYAGDNAFTARMRLHQSWWRAAVLGVPHGRGPTESSANHYGNMLDAAAGAAGRNFITPETFEVAKRRLAEGRGAFEPFRLLHNMLSSQPMCVNLFGALVDQPERSTRLLRALVGDDVARVRRVAVEWAPEPAADYLGDRTAFDAMVEYERRDGAVVLLGIETKLTDTFSQKPYDGERYRRWMRSHRSPFVDPSSTEVASSQHNQLWRNHLLAIAARDRVGSPYAAVRSVVIHHPLDADGARVVASYRALLRSEDDTFAAWTLDEVIDAFEAAASAEERPWLDGFRTRYIALERSEEAWRNRK
jgi:hypothetical protein